MKNAIDKKYDWWKMRLMKKMQTFNTTVLMPYMCIDTTRIILMQLDNNKNVLKQCKCIGRNTKCIESLQMLFVCFSRLSKQRLFADVPVDVKSRIDPTVHR